MLRFFSNHITAPAAALAILEISILFLLLLLLPLVGVPGVVQRIPISALDVQLLGLAAVVNCMTMMAVGLYHRTAFFDVKRVVFRVALSLPIAIIIVSIAIVGYSTYLEVDVKPYFSLAAISIATLYLEVGIVRSLVIDADNIKIFRKRVQVLGCGDQAYKIKTLLDLPTVHNFEVFGYFRLGDEAVHPKIESSPNHDILGARGSLLKYVRQNMIDEIVIAVQDRRRPKGGLGQGLPVWDLLE